MSGLYVASGLRASGLRASGLRASGLRAIGLRASGLRGVRVYALVSRTLHSLVAIVIIAQ